MTEQELMDLSIACKYCEKYAQGAFDGDTGGESVPGVSFNCEVYRYSNQVDIFNKCLDFELDRYAKLAYIIAEKDGERWKKRSDGSYIITLNDNPSLKQKLEMKQNESKKTEGCYIATAVYGSYSAPEVITLRRFRDNILYKHFWGRVFISIYYSTSPFVAKKLKNTKPINLYVKALLDKFVALIQNNWE